MKSEEESRPNKQRDIDHLATHRLHKRHYFLTFDRGILRRSISLASEGIRVLSPKDALEVLDGPSKQAWTSQRSRREISMGSSALR
jgi:hypothetical protein